MIGEQIAATALSYCNTPFHPGGRLPGVGLDCAGIPACAYAENGIQVEDTTCYSFPPSPVLLWEMMATNLGAPRDEMQVGDVVGLKWPLLEDVIHAGVWTPEGIVTVERGGKVEAQHLSRWGARIAWVFGIREGDF